MKKVSFTDKHTIHKYYINDKIKQSWLKSWLKTIRKKMSIKIPYKLYR